MNVRQRAFTAVAAGGIAIACAAATPQAIADIDASAPGDTEFRTEVSQGWAVTTTIDAGTFQADQDGAGVTVLDAVGQPAGRIPLAFVLDNRKYEIQPQISADGRTLSLLPDIAGAQPIASPLENQLALDESQSKLGLAMAVGPLAGAIGGAVIGVVVALASCAVLTIGCLLTGLPIIGVFAGAGGLAGTILGGGAAAAYAVWNYLDTLSKAPGDSRYAKDGEGTNAAGVPDSHLRIPKLATGSGGGSSSGSGKR
ncbi:hypothetical protein ACFXPS_19675 [Nocardia sp. NPDC059091]|uniref:hypothetical protein n=1 Tax=unclassified Nocardia TaxID=2637762 RepID=UPI0036C35448